jgi:hypothetical protein
LIPLKGRVVRDLLVIGVLFYKGMHLIKRFIMYEDGTYF